MSGENPYPSLGFNPVPGLPANVSTLRGQINTAYVAVQETNTLLNRLRNSNDDAWKGDAGNAFRNNFDTTLGQDLSYAQSSLEKSVGLMDEWYTNIVAFQDTAKGLETEAAAAITAQTQATTTLRQAQSNPDLQLANQSFSDPTELANAQTRLNNASAQVNSAQTAVDNANSTLASIRQRAIDLQTEYNTVSRRIATELDAAGKDFAPSPPDKSIWDKITDFVKGIGDWISEHRQQIHDVLAGISAVTGLLALVTPPPASAIFAVVALATGAGALATDFMDPEVRDAFGNIIQDGSLNTEALTKIGSTVGLDALSVIPGTTGVLKGGWAAWKGADLGTSVAAFTDGAQSAGLMSKGLNWIPTGTEGRLLLTEFGELGQKGGDKLAGIELFSRSAKAGIGLTSIGEVIGSIYSD